MLHHHEAFEDALNDEIRDRIQDKDPQTLSSAVKAALRVEANLKSLEVRYEDKKLKNVRQVQHSDRNELPPTHFDGPADQPRNSRELRQSGGGGGGGQENFFVSRGFTNRKGNHKDKEDRTMSRGKKKEYSSRRNVRRVKVVRN